jgi:hypothetical protein
LTWGTELQVPLKTEKVRLNGEGDYQLVSKPSRKNQSSGTRKTTLELIASEREKKRRKKQIIKKIDCNIILFNNTAQKLMIQHFHRHISMMQHGKKN